jgi:hypothetical protein
VRSKLPPRLATWLLGRLASGQTRESLIGDLIEQYRNGRSASWYWRQTLGSIVTGAWGEVCDHKLLATRAALVGLATMWAFGAVARFLLQILWVLTSGGVYLGGHWVRLDYGWIHYRMYMAFLLTLLGSAGSGWIVGRFHRDHQAPMVFAFVISVILGALVELLIQVGVVGWTISPVARYPQTLVLWFVLAPISIVIGSMIASRPRPIAFR